MSMAAVPEPSVPTASAHADAVLRILKRLLQGFAGGAHLRL